MSEKTNSAVAWIILALLVIAGIILFSRPSSAPETQKSAEVAEEQGPLIPDGPIVLGAMDPLTGEGAVYGIPLKDATMLAVNEINASSGVDGHQFQLIWEDSKCNPQDGSTAAQKLVEVDKVKFIVSGDCSGAALAAATLTEPAGVMLFSAAASSPDLSTAGDLVFRSYPSDAMAGKVIASYSIKKLSKSNAAVISEQTDYAQGLRGAFTKSVVDFGGKVVADETYNTGDTDFRTQILKLKVAGPDVIYVVPQTPVSGVQILKQMQENGLVVTLLVSDTMLGTDTIANNKTLFVDVYSPTPELDQSRGVTKRFLDNFKAAYNRDPEYPAYMAAAYDQMYMLKEAFEKVGTDPLKVRDWLYAVESWPGALGDTSFDENGDPIIGYNIKRIENGVVSDLGAYAP